MASRQIEAKLIISGEDRASTEIAKVVKAFKDAEKATQFSDKVERLGKAFTDVGRQMKAAQDVMSARGPLETTVKNLAAAEKETARLAKEYDAARKAATDFAAAQKLARTADGAQQAAAFSAEVRRLGSAHKAAEREVKQLSAAFQAQTTTLRATESAASKLGADLSSLERHQAGLARQTDLATRALRAQMAAEEAGAKSAEAQAARSARRREALGTIAAGAGVLAAHKGKQIGMEAVSSAASFDIAVRKQKVYTDISEADQAALLKQATKIGQETQFSNIDVVHAQTAAMQGLPAGFAPKLKAEVAQGIIDNVRNFSTLMDTDLKEGAETIRSYLQASGKDISTKEKALAEANKATNQLVKMAKLGGMSGEDVSQYVKFAAAPGTAAGVSTESLMSLGALARRGGLRGDEAGVFIRSVTSHLVSPTNKGLAALNAAGLNFSDYVHMPDTLSTSALEGQFKNKMGKSFTPEIRRRLDAINQNKGLINNQGDYTAAVVNAVGDILGKDKKGKVRASDAHTAASAVKDFYKVSAGSVDVERLLDDAMSKNMTLAQLNALFTDKQGGKGAITQRQWDEFKVARAEIKKSGDDPNYAKSRADYVFAGVGGSVENLKGSFENLVLQIGNANAGLIKWTADLAGNGIDLFSSLSKEQQQALSIGGGAAALGGGAYGAYTLTKNLLGFGGNSVALNGSAVALNAAAAALTEAAVLQGAKAGAGSLPDVAKKAGFGLPLLAGGLVLGGTAAVGYVLSEYGDAKRSVNGTGGRPDITMNPGDELPGVSGATDKPSWVTRTAPSMTLAPGAMPLTIQGSGITGFGLSGPVSAEAAGKDAGEKVGGGVIAGIRAKAPEVLEQGRALFEGFVKLFGQGVEMPIRFTPGEGGGSGSGIQNASFGGGGGGLGGLIHRASLGGSGGFTGGYGGGIDSGGGLVGSGSGRTVPRGAFGLGTGAGDSWQEAVMRAEGTAGKDPYNVVLGNGRYGLPSKPLTDMTLAEAYRFGRTVRARHGSSSAIGAFQIVGQTMKKFMGEAGLGWDDKFNPENQRKLADVIRRRQGFGAWEGFKVHRGELGNARRLGAYKTTPDEPRLVKGLDGKEGLDLGNGTMKMPDGSIRSITYGPPVIPEPPAGGFGGVGGGKRGGMDAAADRFHAAMDRFENAEFRGRVDVNLTGGGGRVTGMRARGRHMAADMGVSMPDLHSRLGDDVSDWT